jgi:multiple sugar transport system substrate-binding protein
VTLSVWADTQRMPGFQAYEKSHSNVHINPITVSGGAVNGLTIVQRVLLDNRQNSDWPDIAFLGQLNDLAALQRPNMNYLADISNYVPKSVVNNYPPGVLALCQRDGKLYCLRNDVAANVLWYNATLMQQFGYQVPSTWSEYQQLGLKVAKEHPGYTIGNLNGRYGHDAYFWPSQCAEGTPVGANGIKINTTSQNCKRMAELLQPLVDAKVIATDDPWSASYPQKVAPKLLMMPAANWFAAYGFKDTYKLPEKQWAAANMPTWPGEKAWTGEEGGGVYVISKHASSIKAAADLITWMATDTSPNGFQASQPTYPAYGPAVELWAKNGEGTYGSYYAKDPADVFGQVAKLIWPGYSEGNVPYDADNAFALTMTATAAQGGSLVESLPKWQQRLSDLASAAGYQVSH